MGQLRSIVSVEIALSMGVVILVSAPVTMSVPILICVPTNDDCWRRDIDPRRRGHINRGRPNHDDWR